MLGKIIKNPKRKDKNIMIIGPSNSGKTTLAEALY